MKITLTKAEALDFKNHGYFNSNFGSITTIKGQNGEGKSSIGEIASWVLGGLDMMGSKLDPTPTDRTVEKVFAAIILDINGEKQVKFGRELVKGKSRYFINDSVKTATEFDEVVMSVFGGNKIREAIDLFLSLYNPSYFPSMKPMEQREMLLSYVSAPANKEVFKEMPKLQADKLGEALRKKNITELENDNRLNKNNKEKELIAAKAKLELLQSQLIGESIDIAQLQKEHEEINEKINHMEERNIEHSNIQARLIPKKSSLKSLLDKITKVMDDAAKNKQREKCLVCEQDITEETKKKIHEGFSAEYKQLKARHDELKKEIDSTVIPERADQEELNHLFNRRSDIRQAIMNEENRIKAIETIEAAKKRVEDIQDSLNESIFLIDAIKAFKAKEAEIQVKKVQSLFTVLTVRLWNIPKDGEPKATFELEMNGKPYSKLSLGEKAKAGLELIEVLSEQSGIYAPVFVDNAESITSSVFGKVGKNTVQVIAAYAVRPLYSLDENGNVKHDDEGNAIYEYDGKLEVTTQ